jgi:hypothetical protein
VTAQDRRSELGDLLLALRAEAEVSPERRLRLEHWASKVSAELRRLERASVADSGGE